MGDSMIENHFVSSANKETFSKGDIADVGRSFM